MREGEERGESLSFKCDWLHIWTTGRPNIRVHMNMPSSAIRPILHRILQEESATITQ